jgi:hypothetical protein
MDARRDRVVCDDAEVGSLRRADQRSDVRPRELICPLRAVDVCPCRTRTRPRLALGFDWTGCARVPLVPFRAGHALSARRTCGAGHTLSTRWTCGTGHALSARRTCIADRPCRTCSAGRAGRARVSFVALRHGMPGWSYDPYSAG